MPSPYQILGVAENATDAEIKLAYLQQVKDHPPERDQELFQGIQQAYETIKDQDSRLRHGLFNLPSVEFNDLLDYAFRRESLLQIMPADDFVKLLSAAPLEKSLERLYAKKPS